MRLLTLSEHSIQTVDVDSDHIEFLDRTLEKRGSLDKRALFEYSVLIHAKFSKLTKSECEMIVDYWLQTVRVNYGN